MERETPKPWSDFEQEPRSLGFVRDALQSLLANEYSSVYVFFKTILRHPESIVSAVAAVASPCCYYLYPSQDKILQYNISWALVSFAVIFPLTMTLGAAFNRREVALMQLSIFKSSILCIFLAHKDWDWWTLPKNPKEPATSGRAERFGSDGETQHITEVYDDLVHLITITQLLLTAPIVTRARHSHTPAGRAQRAAVNTRVDALHADSAATLHHLSRECEVLKRAGLPANEATRIRQHFFTLIATLNQLRALKQYRTPAGLRAFSRVYILITPTVFGPYYAEIAGATNLSFAIALSLVTTLAMQGLFNLRYELEDPFDRSESPDAVDVVREIAALHDDLHLHCFGRPRRPSLHGQAAGAGAGAVNRGPAGGGSKGGFRDTFDHAAAAVCFDHPSLPPGGGGGSGGGGGGGGGKAGGETGVC